MIFARRSPALIVRALEELRRSEGRGRIVFERELPATEATYGEPTEPLSAALQTALSALGVGRLYAHQAQTIDAVRAGRNVALVTPTASGKTLAFLLPLLDVLVRDPEARALLVYPTNALIGDQERGLRALLQTIPNAPSIGTLTGATDVETRRAYRARPPQILLTNPEMLHLSLLGGHQLWSGFLRGLRFVVLDELHQYRGLFGSHLAMVVRRLRRLALYYGCRPQLIVCSATVGNPGEVAARIGGVPFEVIEGSGAARGPRTLLIWPPPALKGAAGGERGDAGAEAVSVFTALVRRGLGTILFAVSRTAAEAMSMQARERLGPGLAGRVAPYRSGYSAAQRREIEEGLKRGWLLGVVSTNALEVGIDIGGLDAAVLAGFPGSKASFWQQAGRAGRGIRHALAVYVPLNRVVDGYYVSHPDELLTGRFEDAVVDLANPRIAEPHLVCAAAELPLRAAELRSFSPVAQDAVARAVATGSLRQAEGALVARGSPHREVGLRGGGGELFVISAPAGELGTIDPLHLYREAYPNAVYLHGGRRYRVTEVERDAFRVRVRPLDEALATEPVVQTTVSVEQPDGEARLQAGRYALNVGCGPVTVHQTTVAYRERTLRGARQSRLLPLPSGLAYELPTLAWWTVFPAELRRTIETGDPRRFLSALHALEHVLPAAVSLRLVCDPRDVVAVYEPAHAALGGAALFLFDDRAGGAGIAVRAAERAAEMLRAAFEIIRACPCAEGCPACVVSASCWRGYDEAGKAAALALLSEITALTPRDAPLRSSHP